jgi:hypothetical protein
MRTTGLLVGMRRRFERLPSESVTRFEHLREGFGGLDGQIFFEMPVEPMRD